MVEATLRPRGPYSLRLTTGRSSWTARLPGGRLVHLHHNKHELTLTLPHPAF